MAVRSMTGYGAGAFELASLGYRVELRSVNHRHLDLKLRLAREFGPVEMRIRERLARDLSRGHVDVNITPEGGARPVPEISVNEALATRVRAALDDLCQRLALDGAVTLADVLRVDGVLVASVPDLPEDALWARVEGGLDRAVAELVAGREAEGDRLAADLEARLSAVEALAGEIRAEGPGAVAGYQERVRVRLEELLQRDDPTWREQRLGAELALLAERSDVAEELTRITAHVQAMRALLRGSVEEACGRKLEFYAIELNRELNTVAAKSVSAEITRRAVEAKAEVERVREQVANVE